MHSLHYIHYIALLSITLCSLHCVPFIVFIKLCIFKCVHYIVFTCFHYIAFITLHNNHYNLFTNYISVVTYRAAITAKNVYFPIFALTTWFMVIDGLPLGSCDPFSINENWFKKWFLSHYLMLTQDEKPKSDLRLWFWYFLRYQ